MKDFASYEGGKREPSQKEMSEKEWLAEAQKVAASYQGKSENDLMRAIYVRAVEGKKNGTLTNAQIDAFYAQFAPMLDGAKKRRLQKIVAELKKM